MPETLDAATLHAAQDAFGVLYRALSDAYWAATTIEAKDRIRGIADFIYNIHTALNQQDLRSHSAAMVGVTQDLVTAKMKIDKLQQDIDGIIHNIQIASQVVNAIQKASAAGATAIAALTA
jgi:hypothetical protein